MHPKSRSAAGQGLEPQYHPPEGCVLPLDEPAILFNFYPLTQDTRYTGIKAFSMLLKLLE